MSHWQSKSKIRLSDSYFSKAIRFRDKKCQFGARCYPAVLYDESGSVDIRHLQCCHYHSRRKESVRIDPDNADTGCPACHNWIDGTAEGQQWHHEFKLKQLGQNRIDLLLLRANTPGKRDEQMSLIIAKQMLKNYKC